MLYLDLSCLEHTSTLLENLTSVHQLSGAVSVKSVKPANERTMYPLTSTTVFELIASKEAIGTWQQIFKPPRPKTPTSFQNTRYMLILVTCFSRFSERLNSDGWLVNRVVPVQALYIVDRDMEYGAR